jgi:serine/threonine-protein kinase HipA
MVASSLVVEGDEEELALTLNGKKKKLGKNDFLQTINRFDIDAKAIENIFGKFKKSEERWHEFINKSFLPDDMIIGYHDLIRKRASQLYPASS